MITGQLFLFEMPKCFETPARMQTHAYVTSRWAFRVIYSNVSVFSLLKRPAYSIYLSIIFSVSPSFISFVPSLYRSVYRLFRLSIVHIVCRLSIVYIVCSVSLLSRLSFVPPLYRSVYHSFLLSFVWSIVRSVSLSFGLFFCLSIVLSIVL